MYKIEFNPITKVVQKVHLVEAPESFVRTPGVIYAEDNDLDSLGLVAPKINLSDPERASENYWTELITKDNIGDYINTTLPDLDERFLKRKVEDTALELIHFAKGMRADGDLRSEEYLFKTKGYKIDKEGNGDMKSLILREFLEVPEIRFNRIVVVGGEFWLTDGAIILTSTPIPNVSNGYAITFKLEENDTQPFHVGDLIKGIHQEFNEAGDYQGFYTVWMEVVTVTGKNYVEVKVKPQYTGTIKPPIKFLNVARVGNIDPSKKSRQRSIYMSSNEGSITFLDGVNKWDIEPYMVKMCLGNIDKLGDIPGVPPQEGYSAYLKNIISYGKHFEVDEQGNPVPTPIYKGHWNNTIKYVYYDQVTHNGSLWLCTNQNGSVIGDAPDAFDANWSICVGKGDTLEVLYTRTNSATDIPTIPSVNDQGYQNNGFIKAPWTKNPTGVDLNNRYEWVISRQGDEGRWPSFSSPAVYAVYGVDGDTTHFIYQRTKVETAPNTPTTNFINEGWKEDPMGTNASNKYEWVSSRKRINEVWGTFSTPAIWSKYSIDGNDGISPSVYSLVSSVNVVRINSIGSASPSSFSVVCKKSKDNSTVDSADLFLTARKSVDNGTFVLIGSITQTSSISVPTDGGYNFYKIRAYINQSDASAFNNNFITEITVGTSRDGEQGPPGNDGNPGAAGKPGQIPRNRGMFKQGDSYVYNDYYRDIVYHTVNNSVMNFMVRNFGATVTTAPTGLDSDPNWESASKFSFIATDLILADKADIAGFKFYNNTLISQYGKLNGSGEVIDINTLTEEQWPSFYPNLKLDGRYGTLSVASSNFTVDSNGIMTVKNAIINGKITSTTGRIGNFEIGTDRLYTPDRNTSESLPNSHLMSLTNASIGFASYSSDRSYLETQMSWGVADLLLGSGIKSNFVVSKKIPYSNYTNYNEVMSVLCTDTSGSPFYNGSRGFAYALASNVPIITQGAIEYGLYTLEVNATQEMPLSHGYNKIVIYTPNSGITIGMPATINKNTFGKTMPNAFAINYHISVSLNCTQLVAIGNLTDNNGNSTYRDLRKGDSLDIIGIKEYNRSDIYWLIKHYQT